MIENVVAHKGKMIEPYRPPARPFGSAGDIARAWVIILVIVLLAALVVAAGGDSKPAPYSREDCASRWEANRATAEGPGMTRELYIHNCMETPTFLQQFHDASN